MTHPDPVALAARQKALDADRVKIAGLAEHKREKMSASPLALLRGSAPLFYEILRDSPELAVGPEATGFIAGDLHVENFGAYRPSALTFAHEEETSAEAQRAVFDINDFDDATIGPCRYDVLRLGVSLLLGTRDLTLSGAERVSLLDILLESDALALAGKAPAVETPACVSSLLDRVRGRTRKALLDARTEVVGHARRFVRGPRYRDLSMEMLRSIAPAFDAYVASVPEGERPPAAAFEMIDAAFRIAGTGSLGSQRVAVLTRGKGGPDGNFIFDLKEQGEPSSAVLVTPPPFGAVERVRRAAQAMVSHPPRMLGETLLSAAPSLGRRLAPQEDRLDWSRVKHEELPTLARYLGALVGSAHQRALTAPAPAWTESDRRVLRDHAITLAGLHEAIYLAYCA
jgi:uncharacterized protein (DUF2252 family)